MHLLGKSKPIVTSVASIPSKGFRDVDFKACRWAIKAIDLGLTADMILHGLDQLYKVVGDRAKVVTLLAKTLLLSGSAGLEKSHVSAYDRVTASGALQHVREHEDSRRHRDLKSGQAVYFRTPEGRKVRQGHLIEPISGGWKIQGKREAGKFKAPVHHVPHGDILTTEEQQAKYAPGDTGRDGHTISTSESNRRAEAGYSRLGLSEAAVLTSSNIERIQSSTLRSLAMQNRIIPYQDGVADDDYSEMWAHYVSAMITSLRHETSTAPLEDLRELKEYALGKRTDSRIGATITTAGRGAVIRYLKDRTKKEKQSELVDYQEMENNPATRRNIVTVPPEHESELTRTTVRNKLIDQFVDKLPLIEADIVRRKYGLEQYDNPQSDEHIANVLNAAGLMIQVKAGQRHPHTGQIHPKDGMVKWTRNHVATAHKSAINNLKDIHGSNALKQFVKSVLEIVTLKKSSNAELGELRLMAEGLVLQRKLRDKVVAG